MNTSRAQTLVSSNILQQKKSEISGEVADSTCGEEITHMSREHVCCQKSKEVLNRTNQNKKNDGRRSKGHKRQLERPVTKAGAI